MDDQSHIFQLLFQEQIDEYKQSLTSIDDLFEQKQKKEEHPVTITVSFFNFFLAQGFRNIRFFGKI